MQENGIRKKDDYFNIYGMNNNDWQALGKLKFGFVRGRVRQSLVNRLNDNVEHCSSYPWYSFVYQFKKTEEYALYDEPDKILSLLCRKPESITTIEQQYQCDLPHLKHLTKYLVDDEKKYNEFVKTDGIATVVNVLIKDFAKLGLQLIKTFTSDELNSINKSKKKKNISVTTSSSPLPISALKKRKCNHHTTQIRKPIWNIRDYQTKIIAEGKRILKQSQKYYLNLATGGGKSFIVYKMLQDLQPNTIIVFSPRKKINSQNMKDTYISILNESQPTSYHTINTSTDSNWDTQIQTLSQEKRFIVCCTQSISKMYKVISQSGLKDITVWFDEAHWSIEKGAEETDNDAKQFFLTNHTQIEHRIFTSASPNTARVEHYPEIFGPLYTPIHTKELIAQQWLCPLRPRVLEYKTDEQVNLSQWIVQECNTLQRSFTFSFHSSENNAFQLFHQHYLQYKRQLTTIKPFLLIDTQGFNEQNIQHYQTIELDYDYQDDTQFETQENSIAYVCRKYDMGYDFPKLDCVIFSDPKVSHADIIQCIGRGTRSDCKGENGKNKYKHLDVMLPVFVDYENVEDSTYKNIIEVLRYLVLELDIDITEIISKERKDDSATTQHSTSVDYEGVDNRSRVLDLLYDKNILQKPTSSVLYRFCKKHCITNEAEYNEFKKRYPEIPLKQNVYDYDGFRWNIVLDPQKNKYYRSNDEINQAKKKVFETICCKKERVKLRKDVGRHGWIRLHNYDKKIPPMCIGECEKYF